jgi:hypothetical protein
MTDIDPKSEIELSTADGQVMVRVAASLRWMFAPGHRGPVWDQRIAAHVIIRSRVASEPYQNQFAQFLTLRWGKVAEDLILEDTATWEAASRRLAAAGDIGAAAPPLLGMHGRSYRG